MNLVIRAILLMVFLLPFWSSDAHAHNLSRLEAVRAAERFIVVNGYTNQPPASDTSKLTLESIEWTSDRKEILKNRRNSLEQKAFGFVSNNKGKPGWTIAFRYKDLRNKRTGRAVTMGLDGKNTRVQHVDIILSHCKKL